jgi:cytochrome oxidase Cu insertion factor (SCO1/SenC/PrrC family)
MKRSYVIRAIFLTSLILASLPGCSGKPRNLNGSPYEPPKPAPALDLQTLAGDTFDLSTLQGDIVLVYFGYTYCPDVCPTTLAEVKLIFEQLGDQAERVHLIMVTVDPERDTPQVLNAWACGGKAKNLNVFCHRTAYLLKKSLQMTRITTWSVIVLDCS